MFKLFKPKEKQNSSSKAEQDFQKIVDIVKYLDKTEFKKFMDATESVWEGYDKLLRVKTREEKEVRPVDEVLTSFREDGKDA